jgi:ribosomal protein L7/L12
MKCGSQHAVDIAMRTRGTPAHQYYDVYLARVDESKRVEVMKRLRRECALDLAAVKHALSSLPFRMANDVIESSARALVGQYERIGGRVELVPTHARDNEDYGPLQKDRLLMRRGTTAETEWEWQELEPVGRATDANGEFSLDRQACGACGTIGSLASELPPDTPCPACHVAPLVSQGGWVT